ncbi:MAG: hypothetical protein ACR2PH_04655, partial [Desulfobulbia bacterium]
LWNHYVVPQWYVSYNRIAFWDKFAHPKSIPVVPLSCDEVCMKKSIESPDMTKVITDGFPIVWWHKEHATNEPKATR